MPNRKLDDLKWELRKSWIVDGPNLVKGFLVLMLILLALLGVGQLGSL